jgi:glycosyltransferase involved in cell wall biosynthesis
VIYFCIPAHNEERTVGVLLWKIRQVMASFPRDYQILVANDGSTDGTAEVLCPYQRVLPLTVVHVEQRRGYASALELLIREAARRAEYPRRDVIVTLQADFTEDPDELLDLLKRVEAGADIVVANAALPASTPRALRWPRQLGNFLLRRRKWPEGVTDPLGGLRAYRVVVVKRALEIRGSERLLTWDGWAANAELLDLTQPHSRRTEAMESHFRGDRQQRPTRNSLWPLLGSVIRYARGGTGPLAGVALPTPATIDLRDRRRPLVRRPAERPAAQQR